MGQVPALSLLGDLAELQAALEEEWPHRSSALRASGVPLNEGEGEGGSGAGAGEGSGEGEGEGAGGAVGEEKPPWGEDFDAERAWKLTQKLREEAKTAKKDASDARAKVKEFEDKDKSEAQKHEERATSAEQRAAEAEGSALRIEVALDKAPEGMAIAQIRKLAKRLTGTTKEELEADADELFADFVPDNGGGTGSPTGRPRERLRPGAVPAAEAEENDPAKLAAQVPRQF